MGIESNKEAMAMMKNALGSIENRFREAYNKGYKDGLRDGASQVTAKLVSKILEEAEAEPQTMVYPQVDGITPSVIVKTEPQAEIKGSKRLLKGSDEPQTCSFSDCDNFKNPDYERCIECKRKQIKLKTEQTERRE